jgi:hypothetical protein
MNRTDLYNSFNEIDDDILERSDAATGRRTKPVWLKWGAVAACLCLMVSIAVPVLHRIGEPGKDDDFVRPLHVITYNGAYYEGIDMDNTKTLDKYDLPHEITTDMIGSSLGTGARRDSDGKPTNPTFYQYTPYADIVTITGSNQERAQQAVYIVKEDGVYFFALFCNFISSDPNSFAEASEMFAVYGVDEATDIATITVGNDEITDPNKIKEVFENLNNSYAMGNDDFQNSVFKGMSSEEEQQAFCIELADSMAEVRIVTTAGIVINNINYYPTIGYVYWALNYYKLSSALGS